MEENGRLTARVQAMTITAQSEQDVLAIEVSSIQESGVLFMYLPLFHSNLAFHTPVEGGYAHSNMHIFHF